MRSFGDVRTGFEEVLVDWEGWVTGCSCQKFTSECHTAKIRGGMPASAQRLGKRLVRKVPMSIRRAELWMR